jgi:hypothetical protein
VVAEHREHAERRAQGAEPHGDVPRREHVAEGDLVVDVVAEQDDEVGLLAVRAGDDGREPVQPDVRRPGVQVAEQRDPQAVQGGGPARQAQLGVGAPSGGAARRPSRTRRPRAAAPPASAAAASPARAAGPSRRSAMGGAGAPSPRPR